MAEEVCSEKALTHLKKLVAYYDELYKIQSEEKPNHETIKELSVPLAREGLECIKKGKAYENLQERIKEKRASKEDAGTAYFLESIETLANRCGLSLSQYIDFRKKESLGWRVWFEAMSKDEAEKKARDDQRWDCVHATEFLRAGMHRNPDIQRSYSQGCTCEQMLIFRVLTDLDIRPDLAQKRLEELQKEIKH